MEQVALKSLKELAAKALVEIRQAEQGVKQPRNTEGNRERVPPFHTPLGVERGTQRALAGENGLLVVAGLFRVPGNALLHPWRHQLVDSPRGRGRLIWTDGFRAAVATKQNVCWLVDLADTYDADESEGG